MVVVGKNNKIHIYTTTEFSLLICMDVEYPNQLIEAISISPSNLFFSIGFYSGEVHIFSLVNEELIAKNNKKMKLAHCDCLNEFEESMNKEKPTSLSFFDKLIKFKEMIFEKSKKLPFSTLKFLNNSKPFNSFFIKKNELAIATESVMEFYKFSSLEGGRAWCYKQLHYHDKSKNIIFNSDFDSIKDYEIV